MRISDWSSDVCSSDLEDDAESRIRRVTARHGGRPGFEAAGGAARLVRENVHRADIILREPARSGWHQLTNQFLACVEEADPGRPKQIFEHPADREIDAQLLHIDGLGPRGLETVEDDVGALDMRDRKSTRLNS